MKADILADILETWGTTEVSIPELLNQHLQISHYSFLCWKKKKKDWMLEMKTKIQVFISGKRVCNIIVSNTDTSTI